MNKRKRVLLSYVRMDKHPDQNWDYTGLFYLAGALERNGYEAFVYHEGWTGLEQAVADTRPDVLGFSCDAENQKFLEGLIPAFIKKCGEATGVKPYVLVGGPQAEGLGESFLKISGADFILRGEGEEVLPALLDELFSGKSSPQLPGLAWLDEKRTFRESPDIGIVEDLDTLPRPAFHCSLHKSRPYGRVVFTGRGCPFSCAFCVAHVGHRKLRQRKISDVLAEISENLRREKNIRYIVVQDDTFCTDPDRVREFCAGMRVIRKERPVVWFCETHVRTLLQRPGLLREMIESGLVRLQIGIESGDRRVLRRYHKNITPEEVIELVTIAVDMGLPQIAGNFIVGGPREEDGVTEQFIRRLLRVGAGVVDLNTGFLRNYPGTAISNDPVSFGLKVVSPDNQTAGDDYPSVIPEDAVEEEIVALRQALNRAIRQEMKQAIEEKRIPFNRVMEQFRLLTVFGVSSRWMLELQAREHIHEYYRTLYLGEAVPFDRQAPPEKLYPQRTVAFYQRVILRDGIPRLFGTVLSPLEYDLLFYSAGKMHVRQIAAALWKKYGSAYSGMEELVQALMDLLEKMDQCFWVTVFRFP